MTVGSWYIYDGSVGQDTQNFICAPIRMRQRFIVSHMRDFLTLLLIVILIIDIALVGLYFAPN